MNDSGRDEHPKFVITPRKCKLPSDILMVAMSTPQQVSSHPEERVWSHLRKFSEIAQSSVKLGQGSPRERRIRAQPASSSSSNNTAHCTTSTNAREFPREWGSPPSKLSPVKAKLPEGYGVGSVTIRSWIIHRMHDVPVTSFVETRAADSKPNDLLLGSDNAELVSIDASTRRTLRHPDVPWAPDGSCWSSFKMKSERERQERRRQREGASSSQVQDQSVRNSVAPIVPCLLLENFSELLDRREQNRISTPLSTRHLLRELQQRKSVCAVGQVQGDELLNGMESKTTVPVETQCRLSCAVQRPSAAAARLVDRRHSLEQLAPVAHEALLTQRLMRLSSLKKRFKEVCALSDEEKREAAALISQRAQVVLELRRLRSQDRAQQAQCPPRKPPAKAEHDEMRPSFSHSHRAINSLPNGEHLNPAMVRQKSSQRSRPHSTAASRQRLWITTVLHVTALLSFNRIICTEKARQVEAQKRQLAALTIQKVFRSKLIPYYAKQLVNAVATLKPWMADALLRWRQRRLHRSADILRHVLERSRKSNKITACIRAFRQKVGLMPRSAFDSMIDTFEQCIGGNKALLNVSARAKQYPSNEKVIIDRFTLSEICFDLAKQDRAVWRRSPKILTFEDRIGDRMVYMIGSRRYISRFPAPSPLHAWARFAVESPDQKSLVAEAICAAQGNNSALDQAGGQQLLKFLALLRNVVKRQRHTYLTCVSNWERKIIENQGLQQFYDKFRKSLPAHITPKRLQRLLNGTHDQILQWKPPKIERKPYFMMSLSQEELDLYAEIMTLKNL